MRTTPPEAWCRLPAMPTLKEILLVPGNRPKVIADCVKVIEEEVDAKGGLTGLAVKGAFAVVKAVKPGFVPEAVDHMLDDFVEPAGAVLGRRPDQERADRAAHERRAPARSADALLAISDERAARARTPRSRRPTRSCAPPAKSTSRRRCRASAA